MAQTVIARMPLLNRLRNSYDKTVNIAPLEVFQSVRTLPSNRHFDVNDLAISNLKQITSGRPVTVPSRFPAFPEAPVRSAGVLREHSNQELVDNDGLT